MALVKFGGGIIEMRGAIAGNVFSRNKGGNYVRAKTTPINPNTALQQVVRAAMAFLTERWSSILTAGQRTAWNLYGASVQVTNRLGESVNISGFNHYIRSNMIRKQKNAAIIDDGPIVFEIPEQDPTMSIAVSEATQQITITYDDAMDWADEDGGFLISFQGSPQNGQRTFFGGPWRWFDTVAGVNGLPPASPKVGAAQFAVSEGQRQWIYARILRADGRISEPFRAEIAVGA